MIWCEQKATVEEISFFHEPKTCFASEGFEEKMKLNNSQTSKKEPEMLLKPSEGWCEQISVARFFFFFLALALTFPLERLCLLFLIKTANILNASRLIPQMDYLLNVWLFLQAEIKEGGKKKKKKRALLAGKVNFIQFIMSVCFFELLLYCPRCLILCLPSGDKKKKKDFMALLLFLISQKHTLTPCPLSSSGPVCVQNLPAPVSAGRQPPSRSDDSSSWIYM